MKAFNKCGNALPIILCGYSSLTMPSNKLLDLDKNYLEIHPEILQFREQQEAITDETTG